MNQYSAIKSRKNRQNWVLKFVDSVHHYLVFRFHAIIAVILMASSKTNF